MLVFTQDLALNILGSESIPIGILKKKNSIPASVLRGLKDCLVLEGNFRSLNPPYFRRRQKSEKGRDFPTGTYSVTGQSETRALKFFSFSSKSSISKESNTSSSPI